MLKVAVPISLGEFMGKKREAPEAALPLEAHATV
jgi:hypothetical protein